MRQSLIVLFVAMSVVSTELIRPSQGFSVKSKPNFARRPTKTILSEEQLLSKIMNMQREKLRGQGAMDIEKPVIIRCRAVQPGDPCADGGNENSDVTTKIIHFQRHGEGYHNLMGKTWREMGKDVDIESSDPTRNPFVRPEVVDAPLTAIGRQEAIEKQRTASSMLSTELVIVSPLYRAIETAHHTFSHHRTDLPWIAHDGCREDLGLLMCNKRRPLSQTRDDFPYVDFSLITSEEDNLFKHDEEECLAAQAQRGYDFLVDFVSKRPEQHIAIVGHSAWLFNMCNAVMDCGDDDYLRTWFSTSEIRTMEVTFSPRKV